MIHLINWDYEQSGNESNEKQQSENIQYELSPFQIKRMIFQYFIKGACYDFWPDLIHFLFYSYEQVSLEQSNSKVWANIM